MQERENKSVEITAYIKGIEYSPLNIRKLVVIEQPEDINFVPSSCIIRFNKSEYGFSKWVSPKRTRSYPFERVYNTLGTSKRITLIPIVKDEGIGGDRDFIQWDTISLMSLLDVYLIFGYYAEAEKNPRNEQKITNQRFDNKYVLRKFDEISKYHSSALHWNLKQIQESLPKLIHRISDSYQKIGKSLNVKFHNEKGLQKFSDQLLKGADNFMQFSRDKAIEAQNREYLTMQPKELLLTLTKAKITIKNYLGGHYYLTTDEILIIATKYE